MHDTSIRTELASPSPAPPTLPSDDLSDSHRPDQLTREDIVRLPLRATVMGQALVIGSEAAYDRSNRPYLILTLRDRTGSAIAARWWRYPYPIERRPVAGTVCWFRATVEEFSGERQLSIVEGWPMPDADLGAYTVAAHTPLAELQTHLDVEIAALDRPFQALVRVVLSGDVYERFCEWPAAQHHHGAVRHGLLVHSLRVTEIARQLGRLCVPETIAYDTDLVIAAALLHDIGKTQTLPPIAGGPVPARAQQVDHVTLGVLMVRLAATSCVPSLTAERLDALIHALLAHHGTREWGAPVEPATLEAWLVHLADLVEARLWRWSGEEVARTPAES